MRTDVLLRGATSRFVLAFAMAGAAPAFAQAPESQSQTQPAAADAAAGAQAAANPANNSGQTNQIEEIVVTAQFREQNLQETPLAITAVSGAMLEARSQTNIADVANQAPSVTLRQSSASFGPVPAIRSSTSCATCCIAPTSSSTRLELSSRLALKR